MRALTLSLLLAAMSLVCSTDAVAVMPERVLASDFEGDELPGDTCAAEDLTEAEHVAVLHPAIVGSIEVACIAPFEVFELGLDVCDTHACAGGVRGCPVSRWDTQTPFIRHDFPSQRVYSRERIQVQAPVYAGLLGSCTMSVAGDHLLSLYYAQSRDGLEGVRFDALDHVTAHEHLSRYDGCGILPWNFHQAILGALLGHIEDTLTASAAETLADVAIPAVVCPITQ